VAKKNLSRIGLSPSCSPWPPTARRTSFRPTRCSGAPGLGGGPTDPPISSGKFLIDRSGYLRALDPGGTTPGWSDIKVLLAEIQALNLETVVTAPPDEHVH
jgi:hypothetical protein